MGNAARCLMPPAAGVPARSERSRHGLDYKVTWKEVTSSRFDTKAFKSAYASLYTAFTRPAVSRRFVIA